MVIGISLIFWDQMHILTQFIVGVRLSKHMFIITTCHYETICNHLYGEDKKD